MLIEGIGYRAEFKFNKLGIKFKADEGFSDIVGKGDIIGARRIQ
jgi:hypothetical protein